MSEALENMLDEMAQFLDRAAELRQTIERAAGSDRLSNSLQSTGETIDQGIGGTEALASTLEGALRPGTRLTVADGSQSAAALEDMQHQMARFAGEILAPDISSLISEFPTTDIAGKLSGAMQQYSDRIAEAVSWIDERVATLVEASEAILETSTEFAEGVTTAKDALTEKTSEVADGVRQLISALDGLSTERREKLVEKLTAQLEQEISQKLESLTGGALESIASFNDKAEALAGDIVDQLSAVNDTFEKVLDVVEPIRPVIDLAASIS